MARELYVVFADIPDVLQWSDRTEGKMDLSPKGEALNKQIFGVFPRKEEAEEYAKNTAMQFPGFEIYLLEVNQGFFNQPSPKIINKIWKNGEYLVNN